MPGLLGVALSGAGPSIVALVDDNEEEIGARIASCFRAHKIRIDGVRILDVDNEGCLRNHCQLNRFSTRNTG